MRQLPVDLGHDVLLLAGALFPRLQAGKGDRPRHVRKADDDEIGLNLRDLAEDLLDPARILRREGDRRPFRCDADRRDRAAILHRRELGPKPGEEEIARAGDAERQQDDHRADRQRTAQRRLVTPRQRVEAALEQIVEPAMALVMPEQLGAHHRRQGQRDEAGNENGSRQRQRELDEELARAAGREGHWRIDSDQRQRHRHHSEGDLVDAADRRGIGLHAVLDMAVDVLQHDDGVVDHDADRQHHREQRQRVNGEAESVHQRKGADERHRDGDERDQRGAQRAQEDEDDQHDEDNRLEDRRVDGLDRAIDEDRAVIGGGDRHPLWQILDDLGQGGPHAAGDVQRVGGGLLDDADRDRRFAGEPGGVALRQGAQLDARNVAQLDREVVGVLDDDLLELLRRRQPGLRENGELAIVALDAARRDLDVLGADRRLDLLNRDVVGRHAGPIEPDAHGVAPLAADLDLGDAGDVLHPVGDEAVGEIGQLKRVVSRADQRQEQDRLRIRLDLGDDRLVDLGRHTAAHAADAVAHVRRGDVGIDVGPETHRDVALLLAAGRGDDLDALDARDRVL